MLLLFKAAFQGHPARAGCLPPSVGHWSHPTRAVWKFEPGTFSLQGVIKQRLSDFPVLVYQNLIFCIDLHDDNSHVTTHFLFSGRQIRCPPAECHKEMFTERVPPGVILFHQCTYEGFKLFLKWEVHVAAFSVIQLLCDNPEWIIAAVCGSEEDVLQLCSSTCLLIGGGHLLS